MVLDMCACFCTLEKENNPEAEPPSYEWYLLNESSDLDIHRKANGGMEDERVNVSIVNQFST